MAVSYLSPGVYVEEIDKGTKPIEAVGTSMAAFIGLTAEASRKRVDDKGNRVPVETVLGRATLVTSWTQFVDIFGAFTPGAFMPDAVYGYFANGGGPCYVTSLRALTEGGAVAAASVSVPSTGKGDSFKVTAKTPGPSDLRVTIKTADDGTLTLAVGAESKAGLVMKKGEATFLGDADFEAIVISNVNPAAAPKDGAYPLVGGGIAPLTADDFVGDPGKRTGIAGLEALDPVRLLVCPDVMAGYDGSDAAKERIKMIQTAMIQHCEKRMKYRFAILDTPPGLNAQQAAEWKNYVNFDTSHAALYYPWIRVADFSDSGSPTKLVPPGGHMAGIFNRSDAERGVHKAPANEVVLGAIDLEIQLSKGEQDVLNPIGVNCIRAFPGRGIRVWGGRTLSSNGAWRYVNVRRLFIMVEASMDAGLQWVVFEPNDSTLWAKVRRDVTSFLRVVWRSGALFGATPEQAFYVKCDEELNPLEVRDLGQLVIEVGLAPVKPAEFVIFRITQWAGANAEA